MTLVGEEDSEALTEGGEGGAETLAKVVNLVNKTLKAHMGSDAPELSSQEVVDAINKGQSSGGAKGKHWILDPVDGTLGFVRGDQYAIALALMDEGDLKVGVMGCPNMPKQGDVLEFETSYSYGFSPRLVSKMLAGDSLGWYKGCIFTAVRGHGAYVFPCDPNLKFEPAKVSVSDAFDPRKAKFTEPGDEGELFSRVHVRRRHQLGHRVKAAPHLFSSQVRFGRAGGCGRLYEVPQGGLQRKDLGSRGWRDSRRRGGWSRFGRRRRPAQLCGRSLHRGSRSRHHRLPRQRSTSDFSMPWPSRGLLRSSNVSSLVTSRIFL
jgi:HAL2 family 3'(2'),5'-bisphosphate nucleotidase